MAYEGRLWLDALYLRARPPRLPRRLLFLYVENSARLYATRMTLQGDGAVETQALWSSEDSRVYLHGSTIDSVGGLFSTVDIIEGSAFLNQVTLSNVWHDTFYPETEEAGLSPAPAPAAGDYDAAAPGPGGFDYYDYARQRYVEAVPMEVRGESASIVALNMTFENVTTVAEHMFVSYSGGLVVAEDTAGAEEDVYTVDYDYESYGSWTSVRDTVAAAPASALEQFPTQRVPLATAGDPWFVALQKAIEEAQPEQVHEAPEPPPNPPRPPPPGVPGGAPPQIAAVYNAAQLQRAFHAGVRDIEIRGHLDLRGLPRWEDPVTGREPGAYQLGFVGRGTRSIRGRCMSPPPAELTPDNLGVKIAAGEPWRAPRCVLAVAQHLLVATSPGLWLDSLHVQFARWPEPVAEVDDDDYSPPIDYTYAYGLPEYPYDFEPEGGGSVAVSLVEWATVYITNTAIQGDGVTLAAAAWVDHCAGGLYMRDCVVNAMPGRRRLLESRAPVAYVTYGAALFDSCAFVDTGLMASEAVYTSDYDYNGWTASSGGLEVHGENATLALRKCTFTDTVAEPPVVASSLASFFSDSPGLLAMLDYNDYGAALGGTPGAAVLTESWPEGLPARTPAPPQADDPWFLAAQQALKSPTPAAYLSQYDAGAAADPAAAPATAPAPSAAAPGPGPAAASLLPPPRSRTPFTELGLRGVETKAQLSNAAIIGIVLGALVLLGAATCIAAGVALRRRAGRSADGAAGSQTPQPPGKQPVEGEGSPAKEESPEQVGGGRSPSA